MKTQLEHWKPVVGYEGLYEVSDMGRIRSLNYKGVKGKIQILKPSKTGKGYLMLILCKNQQHKHVYIHRLVAETFIPNPECKNEVNHINEDKTDNRAVNLNWMTRKENVNWGTGKERVAKAFARHTAQYTLNGKLVKIWKSAREAARQTGFNQGNISSCCVGRYKQAYGFIWCYL